MRGLLILANGFEDTEALTTLDVLRRAKLEVTTVSVMDDINILTQSNVWVKSDKHIGDIDYTDYDFLIVPGGKAVFNKLDKLPVVDEIITHFVTTNKLSAFICAAPHLPGKLGLLSSSTYTCFPGCNDEVIGGVYLKDESLVQSSNIITCRSMAYSIDFALLIIEQLLGKNQKEIIKRSIRGLE